MKVLGYEQLRELYFEFDWSQEDALIKYLNLQGVIIATVEQETEGV